MAVTPSSIEGQVNTLIDQTKILEPAASQEAFAKGLSVIIANAILSAQVVIPIGAVIVVGSPTTQNNPAPVTGTLQ